MRVVSAFALVRSTSVLHVGREWIRLLRPFVQHQLAGWQYLRQLFPVGRGRVSRLLAYDRRLKGTTPSFKSISILIAVKCLTEIWTQAPARRRDVRRRNCLPPHTAPGLDRLGLAANRISHGGQVLHHGELRDNLFVLGRDLSDCGAHGGLRLEQHVCALWRDLRAVRQGTGRGHAHHCGPGYIWTTFRG